MTSVLERILEHEGFREKAYPDPLSGGEPYTFGHGLTFILEHESRRIVAERIAVIRQQLIERYPWMSSQPQDYIDVLVEMVYQMGMAGVSKFRNHLAAAERHDYQTAAREMLDSKWAKQTPSRAQALAAIVRGLA